MPNFKIVAIPTIIMQIIVILITSLISVVSYVYLSDKNRSVEFQKQIVKALNDAEKENKINREVQVAALLNITAQMTQVTSNQDSQRKFLEKQSTLSAKNEKNIIRLFEMQNNVISKQVDNTKKQADNAKRIDDIVSKMSDYWFILNKQTKELSSKINN